MAEPPQPPGTQRKSRVLAALDNPAFFSPNPATPPPLPSTLPPTSFGLPSLSQTPLKRLETPLPDPDYLALLGGAFTQGTKRKASVDPENDFGAGGILSPPLPGAASVVSRGFSLRYDQETAVRSIDRGGPDQKTRYVKQSYAARRSLFMC